MLDDVSARKTSQQRRLTPLELHYFLVSRRDWRYCHGQVIHQPNSGLRFDLIMPRPRVSISLQDNGSRQQWGYVGARLNGATWGVQRTDGVDSKQIERAQRYGTRFTTGSDEVLDERVDKETPSVRTKSTLLRIDRSVSGLLNRLDEREPFIVKARYGLIDLGMKPTCSRMGKKLGVSNERVRQLEIRAMNKLRDLVKELGVADPGSTA